MFLKLGRKLSVPRLWIVQFIDSIRGDRLIELTKEGNKLAAEPRGNYRNFAGFSHDDLVYLTPKIFRQLCSKFGGTPSVSRVFQNKLILETNCGENSYQYQLSEVRAIDYINKDNDTTLGKVVWRRNSKTYAINLNKLELYAYPKKKKEDEK